MVSLNRVMLIGHLGADPELRFTQSNQAVCNFRIATSEWWKDRNGQKQERTEWHRITVWGAQAEACATYLRKGRPVFVEGKIQTREWEDRDGNKRYTTEIVAERVQFLGGRDGGERDEREEPGERERYRGVSAGGHGGGSNEPPPLMDDDIPF